MYNSFVFCRKIGKIYGGERMPGKKLLFITAAVLVLSAAVLAINFEKNSSKIPEKEYTELDGITARLGDMHGRAAGIKITISGYTDNRGTDRHNMEMARERSGAVKDYIMNKYSGIGLTDTNFIIKPRGPVNFVADNLTDEGRSKNRRVEIKITLAGEDINNAAGVSVQPTATAPTVSAVTESRATQDTPVAAVSPVATTVQTAETSATVYVTPTTEQAAIPPPVHTEKNEDPCWGCAGLIALDAALTGYAVYAVLDQRNAAQNYNKKYAELDDPLGTNYAELSDIKKNVDNKKTPALIGSCLAGAAVAYTAADIIWLHIVFPGGAKVVTFVPYSGGAMLTYREAF
jgi:hypothetical protein